MTEQKHDDARRASRSDAELGSNLNNCAACDYKKHPDGGWCYMWRDEPTNVCMQHTARGQEAKQLARLISKHMAA